MELSAETPVMFASASTLFLLREWLDFESYGNK